MKVLVIGGSDQGRQVIDAVSTRREHEVVGLLDDGRARGDDVAGVPVVGTIGDLHACVESTAAEGYVVAVGDNFTRGALTAQIETTNPALTLVTVTHATAVVAADASVGAGCILLAGSIVGNGSTVGHGVLLGTASSIDHDCVLGDVVSLAPGAHVAGGVRVGRGTAIGVGASVVHRVSIGDDTVVGAGAVIVGDIPDRVVAYGVPARVVRAREPGERYL